MIGYEDKYFTYTKVSPRESASIRKESRRAQKEMIMLYACYGLLDDIFLTKEVSLAKTHGLLPKGWSCHHIIPISGGGTNSVDNLCIIARDFHDAIETIYSVQTAHLKIGESVYYRESVSLSEVTDRLCPFCGFHRENRVSLGVEKSQKEGLLLCLFMNAFL